MDDYKHSSIDFNVIQACGDELADTAAVELFFRKEFNVPYVSIKQCLDSQFDQQNGIITLCGQIGFKKLTEGLIRFLNKFCIRYVRPMLLNFEDTLFSLVLSNNSFEVYHQIKLRCLSMGTLAKLTSFIAHFSTSLPLRSLLRGQQYVVSICEDDLFARFIHSKSEVHLHFRIIFKPCEKKSTIHYRYQRYKLVLSYKSINHLILNQNDKSLSTYVSVSHPVYLYVLKKDFDEPIVYKKDSEECEEKSCITNFGIEFEKDPWIRRTESYVFSKDVLGKCNTLKLDLYKPEDLKSIPDHQKMNFPCPFEVINSLFKLRKCPVYFGYIREISKKPPENGAIAIKMENEDCFKVVYALLVLQSISYQFANDLLLSKIKNKMDASIKDELQVLSKNVNVFERSLYDLFHTINSGCLVQSLYFLRKAVERNAQEVLNGSITKDIFQTRRAILTPTRTLLLPPLPVMGSRFLLKSSPDYVLRLTLRDDDLQRLTFSLRMMDTNDSKKFIRDSVKKPLVEGIRIGNRRYEVVGSSPSQMRDNGMCLYAKDEQGRIAAKIRSDFGIIQKENVSKYVSRVGLMLSQSQFFMDASDAKIKYNEPDINCQNSIHPISKKPYDFSDGCGMISMSYAEKITNKLKEVHFLPENALIPSAYQIRLGGCKGILAVNPMLKSNDIVIRNSMQKFISNDKILGILKVSDLRRVYLNQPFITVLNQIGIETSIFLKMQLHVLHDILHSFVAEKNAATILKEYSILRRLFDYNSLIASGINILNEPFFRLSLDNVITHTIHLLKKKSRIVIPFQDGRTVFGIIDETKTLKKGEVFLQTTVDFEDRFKTEVWKGAILVTKFPCMAAGDVRIFKAVDVDSLHHIRDCIVFPAFGDRPHPNEMSGSDLDGDEYAVIRYKPLLNVNVKSPMVYPDNFPLKSTKKITNDEILSLYAASIENDSVGTIANAHMAWADLLPNGILDPKCEELAEAYSRALDSPKTGEIVLLKKEQKALVTPDFMDKFSHKPTYLSKRALGSLFRQICLFEIAFREQNPLTVVGVDVKLFSHPDSVKFTNEAKRAYSDYKYLIINIQKLFKIKTEVEIITGLYNKVDEFMVSKDDVNDARQMINMILRNGVTKIKELFESNCVDEEQKLAKASAYYHEARRINSLTNTPFYGLPWLFSECLSTLAARNRTSTTFETEETRLKNLGHLIDKRLVEEGKMSMKNHICLNSLQLAENILIEWLRRQTYLKLSLCDSKALAESIIKDTMRVETERYHTNTNIIPSVGLIVINCLKRLVSKEITPDFGVESETKNFKYNVGFSSLMALYRLYRSHSIDHIITPRSTGVLDLNIFCIRTFRMQFDVSSILYEFVKINEKAFLKYIRGLTGIAMLKGKWFRKTESSWPFELFAIGTHTQMYALGYLLSKILFSNGPNIIARVGSAVRNGCSQPVVNENRSSTAKQSKENFNYENK